jgi:succinate dehydrogenase/fumarate reductase cytochrome b subunit
MTLLSIRATATRRDVAIMIFRYGPATTALVYPLALAFLHISGWHFMQATDAIGRLLAGLATCLAAALLCSVPALSFTVMLRSDRSGERWLAHVAFAAPPLFTMLGVGFFFIGVPNGDYVIWAAAWLGVLAYAAFASPAITEQRRPARWIRTAHGLTGATITASFLVWHLANHTLAIWSFDAHKDVMLFLRTWYRSGLVQPFLVALLVAQLVTGTRLLQAKIPRAGDLYSSIQTATAGYLLAYIPSHLIAVFILGRWFLGVDTNFEWASGAPSGLLLDSWNVRLIPHYSSAVLFVICHFAVGLRAILLGRRIRAAIADRVTWTLCAIGLVVSFVIAVAQLRV